MAEDDDQSKLSKEQSKKVAKAAALASLKRIQARIEYYKSIKQAPSFDLLKDAQEIADQFPDLKAILEDIKNANQEAIRAAEANIPSNPTSAGSWLNSDARKVFDAEVAKDPLKTLAEHFDNSVVIKNLKILNEIIAGQEIPEEKFNDVVNQAQSEEMRYKRNAFLYYAPTEIEKLEKQSKEREAAEKNLADIAKEEILDQVVLQRKAIRDIEKRSTDHHVVIKEDKHLICERVAQTVYSIEINITGGLVAVGAAGNKAVEVIQDVLVGRVEEAARKVEIEQKANAVIVEQELQREMTEKIQKVVAIVEAKLQQETADKILKIEDKDVFKKQIEIKTAGVNVDKLGQDEAGKINPQTNARAEARKAQKLADQEQRALKQQEELKTASNVALGIRNILSNEPTKEAINLSFHPESSNHKTKGHQNTQ